MPVDPNQPIDPRLQRLLDAMRNSAQPVVQPAGNLPPAFTAQPQVNVGDAPPPAPAASPPVPGGPLPQPSGMQPVGALPDPSYTPETPHPRIGISLRGLTGVDKSLADLGVNRDAANQFPSSQVKDGEILPPKMHHGLMDKLKSAGKTAVISMGDYARTHPNASGIELATAGAIGGGIGATSPTTGDALMRRLQVQQQESDVSRQLELEGQQAQVGHLRKLDQTNLEKPVYESRNVNEGEYQLPEGTEIRQQWNPRSGKLEDVMGPDGKPMVVKRPASDKMPKPMYESRSVSEGEYGLPEGTKIRQQVNAEGQLEDVVGSDKKPIVVERPPKEKPQPNTPELVTWYEKKQQEQEQSAADLRTKANAIVAPAGANGYLTDAQKADKEDLLRRANESDKAAREYRDKRDVEAVKPSNRAAAPTLSQPETRKGTISKQQQQTWLTDNPGKTLKDMKALYPNAVIIN